MPKSRPEIDEDLIRKCKLHFPETALMGIAETIEYVLKRAIEGKAKEAS